MLNETKWFHIWYYKSINSSITRHKCNLTELDIQTSYQCFFCYSQFISILIARPPDATVFLWFFISLSSYWKYKILFYKRGTINTTLYISIKEKFSKLMFPLFGLASSFIAKHIWYKVFPFKWKETLSLVDP